MGPPSDPFVLFSDIHFWRTDLRIFLKAPLTPIYTNFEEERAPKQRNFLVEIFQKVPKNAISGMFFKSTDTFSELESPKVLITG